MTIMNTQRHIYHWKDGKNLLEKLFPEREKIPHGAKFLKNSSFTRNAVLMQNLDLGRKIRRICFAHV